MAIKFPVSFPIFGQPLHSSQYPDPNANSPAGRPLTEIRFARWSSANAEKFVQHRRSKEEIKDDVRRYHRFDSTAETADVSDTDSAAETSGKSRQKFRYSKKTQDVHPAFRRISKAESRLPDPKFDRKAANVKIADDGLSYVIDGAPFEFKYSYTETPKVKPVKLREPPFTPFGPVSMPRPWTGRAPFPPSKKKPKEFDSFVLPPPNKKGVKPVQKPGPFLPGTGPRYVMSREEILGEPLTKQEIKEMMESCNKSKRQLNMGRDGLTHNMLDNIHAHWKRRRACKIKCKGVCTVDMDNVCQQLEEKTGGKIIYRAGGVLYLFRGRNYNYRTRPRFPLMLWKPVTPVFPKLIKRAPEGLTCEEAAEMRKKGRNLIPICKIGKNGVYCDLVKNVREAFEECELVRINCQGLNKSDCKKIGAKLKDLVPCVLLSFEFEHILMCRGDNWQPSLGKAETNIAKQEEHNSDVPSVTAGLNSQEVSLPCLPTQKDPYWVSHSSEMGSEIVLMDLNELPVVEKDDPDKVTNATSSAKESNEISDNLSCHNDDETEHIGNVSRSCISLDNTNSSGVDSEAVTASYDCEKTSDCTGLADEESAGVLTNIISKTSKNDANHSESFDLESPVDQNGVDASGPLHDALGPARIDVDCTQRIIFLMKQAIESGSALVLDDACLDADRVYQQAVTFAQSVPPGPVFRHHLPKVAIQKVEKKENRIPEVENSEQVQKNGSFTKKVQRNNSLNTEKVQKKSSNAARPPKKAGWRMIDERYLDVVPKGTLGVDELAKLLSRNDSIY